MLAYVKKTLPGFTHGKPDYINAAKFPFSSSRGLIGSKARWVRAQKIMKHAHEEEDDGGAEAKEEKDEEVPQVPVPDSPESVAESSDGDDDGGGGGGDQPPPNEKQAYADKMQKLPPPPNVPGFDDDAEMRDADHSDIKLAETESRHQQAMLKAQTENNNLREQANKKAQENMKLSEQVKMTGQRYGELRKANEALEQRLQLMQTKLNMAQHAASGDEKSKNEWMQKHVVETDKYIKQMEAAQTKELEELNYALTQQSKAAEIKTKELQEELEKTRAYAESVEKSAKQAAVAGTATSTKRIEDYEKKIAAKSAEIVQEKTKMEADFKEQTIAMEERYEKLQQEKEEQLLGMKDFYEKVILAKENKIKAGKDVDSALSAQKTEYEGKITDLENKLRMQSESQEQVAANQALAIENLKTVYEQKLAEATLRVGKTTAANITQRLQEKKEADEALEKDVADAHDTAYNLGREHAEEEVQKAYNKGMQDAASMAAPADDAFDEEEAGDGEAQAPVGDEEKETTTGGGEDEDTDEAGQGGVKRGWEELLKPTPLPDEGALTVKEQPKFKSVKKQRRALEQADKKTSKHAEKDRLEKLAAQKHYASLTEEELGLETFRLDRDDWRKEIAEKEMMRKYESSRLKGAKEQEKKDFQKKKAETFEAIKKAKKRLEPEKTKKPKKKKNHKKQKKSEEEVTI
eukprot:gb/GEZN01003218.1/.p1 GENE.gb/GEZN01003218.1/~~gb/GEZN01003218.1/.p1  ORF type:complete len:691 (+),score=228.67 gb/GEZN01003218.1/:73-2145(+)